MSFRKQTELLRGRSRSTINDSCGCVNQQECDGHCRHFSQDPSGRSVVGQQAFLMARWRLVALALIACALSCHSVLGGDAQVCHVNNTATSSHLKVCFCTLVSSNTQRPAGLSHRLGRCQSAESHLGHFQVRLGDLYGASTKTSLFEPL